MRTTLTQQTQNALMYTNSATNRLSILQERAVSGKRISKSSDDVPGTSNAMSLRSSIKSIEQFASNITTSQPLLKTTLSAVDQITDITNSVRNIALAAVNPDFTGNTRQTYLDQLDGLMEQLVDVAKTKHNDQYIFSGTASSVCPISENTASDPETGLPPFTYDGSTQSKNVKVLAWVTLPVNVAGNDIFGFESGGDAQGSDIFSMITRLKNAIESGDSDSISSEISNIDKNYDNILTWSSRLGSWSARMDNASTTLEETKVRLKEMLSDTEDIDISEAVVELKTQQNVYQVAVSVTQMILELSLASQYQA